MSVIRCPDDHDLSVLQFRPLEFYHSHIQHQHVNLELEDRKLMLRQLLARATLSTSMAQMNAQVGNDFFLNDISFRDHLRHGLQPAAPFDSGPGATVARAHRQLDPDLRPTRLGASRWTQETLAARTHGLASTTIRVVTGREIFMAYGFTARRAKSD